MKKEKIFDSILKLIGEEAIALNIIIDEIKNVLRVNEEKNIRLIRE